MPRLDLGIHSLSVKHAVPTHGQSFPSALRAQAEERDYSHLKPNLVMPRPDLGIHFFFPFGALPPPMGRASHPLSERKPKSVIVLI